MKKRHITIKQKLYGGFFIALVITLIVGGRGVLTSSNILEKIQDIQDKDLELLLKAEKLKHAALTHRRYEKDFFLNIGNQKKQEGYLGKFDKISTLTQDLLDQVAGQVNTDSDFPADLRSKLQETVTSLWQILFGFQITFQKCLSRCCHDSPASE